LPLRIARGILTGHSQLNRHLSVMGIISDPTCNYCEEGLETAAYFLCECSHFVTLRQRNLIYTLLKLTQYRIL